MIPIDSSAFVLAGARAALRPIEPADAAAAFALLAQRESILRWLVWDGPASQEELERHYADWAANGENGSDYQLAIVALPGRELAGAISLRLAGHPDVADLGYWIGEPHWGKGLATEAIALAAELCFERLGARALTAQVFAGNESSRRVLLRNGFALVHTAPGGLQKRGAPVDVWHFARAREPAVASQRAGVE